MAGNKLSVLILTPAMGSFRIQNFNLVLKNIIKVTRENQVLYRSTPTPTGTLPKYQHLPIGYIVVSSELPFNGSEKLTVIYKDLI